MRVVVMKVDNHGYLGYSIIGTESLYVFGNMEMAEEFLGTKYTSVLEVTDKYDEQGTYRFDCTTKNYEQHYITLYDKEIIDKLV